MKYLVVIGRVRNHNSQNVTSYSVSDILFNEVSISPLYNVTMGVVQTSPNQNLVVIFFQVFLCAILRYHKMTSVMALGVNFHESQAKHDQK